MATQKESIIPVPDEYQMTFKRLLNRVPKKKRRDKKLQETLLVCMKLGGEELTRQRIKLEKVKFAEKPELFKRRVLMAAKEAVDSIPAADEKKTVTELTPAADEPKTTIESAPAADEPKTSTESAPAAETKATPEPTESAKK